MTEPLSEAEIAALYALGDHGSAFEIGGAILRDEASDDTVLSNPDHYDRRILLVTLRSALATPDRAGRSDVPSHPSPGESDGFDALVDDLRAEFDQGHFMPWGDIIARIAATLDATRPSDDEALRAAARAVIAKAEPDESYEGEFIEYLVDYAAIDALRAALATPAPSEAKPEAVNDRLDAVFGSGFTAGAAAEEQADLAERYVKTRAVIEWADLRATLDGSDGVGEGRTVSMREADWNRVVAVARGHVSAAAQKVIERVLEGDLS